MQDKYNSGPDRVFTLDEFKQFDRLNQNTNSRIPIFFCVDVSGSMASKVGILETRLSLLSKVMKDLLINMQRHPVLSERAVISIVTYNNRAILHQPALDLGVLDIEKAVSFDAMNQTVFSLGLRRTLQAIDQYRDGVRRSDVDTFTPMLVFMTDGEPVGDSDKEIETVYNEVWSRVQNNDLYVFPIGISRQANMRYVYALNPTHQGHQIIDESDFEKVFAEIGNIVNGKPDKKSYEEGEDQTEMASLCKATKDTGAGMFFNMDDFKDIIDGHISY